MERVLGIGGFFFASADPEALQRWYANHLGVDSPPQSYDETPWRQAEGPTVFAAMGSDTPHLQGRSYALNFRVADLEAMVTQVRNAGIEVAVDPETYPNGRFAEFQDPEGNSVQLWEVAGDDSPSQ